MELLYSLLLRLSVPAALRMQGRDASWTVWSQDTARSANVIGPSVWSGLAAARWAVH